MLENAFPKYNSNVYSSKPVHKQKTATVLHDREKSLMDRV